MTGPQRLAARFSVSRPETVERERERAVHAMHERARREGYDFDDGEIIEERDPGLFALFKTYTLSVPAAKLRALLPYGTMMVDRGSGIHAMVIGGGRMVVVSNPDYSPLGQSYVGRDIPFINEVWEPVDD